jgi:membrane protein YdbS with pleckstrin-like domain
MGAAADTGAQTAGTEIELDRAVDARAVPVWRWSAAMTCTPAVIAASVFVIVATVASSPAAIVVWIGWTLLLAAVAAYVWKYPPARHRHLRYRIDDVGITIRDGVFWRTWSALPRVRIQHTDVSQGPLQRRYGVAELKLYTAGSRFTRIDLPGLEHAVALALRDELQRHANDDAV